MNSFKEKRSIGGGGVLWELEKKSEPRRMAGVWHQMPQTRMAGSTTSESWLLLATYTKFSKFWFLHLWNGYSNACLLGLGGDSVRWATQRSHHIRHGAFNKPPFTSFTSPFTSFSFFMTIALGTQISWRGRADTECNMDKCVPQMQLCRLGFVGRIGHERLLCNLGVGCLLESLNCYEGDA